jgi:2-polyprenyl-6-methoxyphenol hydroxylase-like FAD-dependent oxidoreductase
VVIGLQSCVRQPAVTLVRPSWMAVFRTVPGVDHWIDALWWKPRGAGSVLIIGDPADATSPNMASGAAIAFEDALMLGKLMASGRSVAHVQNDDTTQRVARIRWEHDQTRRRDRIRSLPPMVRDPMTRFLTNSVYRANYGPLAAALV